MDVLQKKWASLNWGNAVFHQVIWAQVFCFRLTIFDLLEDLWRSMIISINAYGRQRPNETDIS